MKIIFLIPVYNEALNIPELAENLINVLPGYNKTFLFVDDCSDDHTIDIIKTSFSDQKLFVIEKDRNKGPGDSFNLGFEWIISHDFGDDDMVVTLEGDNTSDPGILNDMITISGLGYKLVLASVYAQGGGLDKTNWLRRFISFTANMMMRMVFEIKVLTLSSFYRVYHVGLLRQIKQSYGTIIEESGYISMIEILVKSIRLKTNIIEVPMILHSAKRKGKSKMKVIKTAFRYLKFLIKSKKITPINK